MKTRPFKQVDVFTAEPYLGNPVAVVLDGEGLSDERMQSFARWTNLSETTFVLPPEDAAADFRVRIFTPGGELPFAGHPTLGTCHAWLEAGGKPKSREEVVLQCAVGLVRVRRADGSLAFAAPPCKMSTPAPTLLAKVAAALGLKSQQIVAARTLDNGPVWLGLLLDASQTVLAIAPDHAALKALGQKVGVSAVIYGDGLHNPSRRAHPQDRAVCGVAILANSEAIGGESRLASHPDLRRAHSLGVMQTIPSARPAEPNLEVRAFAAAMGIPEDPVTGSLNASLAQWLIEDGHLPARYIAAQGQCLWRAGRVEIERDADGQVWVGGESVTCVDGAVTL